MFLLQAFSNRLRRHRTSKKMQEVEKDMSSELNLEDISSSLRQLSLTCVELGDYLMVIKSNLDLFIDNEPYLALMLILNRKSGNYKVKLWNETLSAGKSPSAEELIQVCKKHFCLGKPCVGFELQMDDRAPYEGLLSLLPIPRKVAKDCHKFLKKGTGDDNLCPECKKLSVSKNLANVTVDIKSDLQDAGCKNEVTLPKEEPYEYIEEGIEDRSEDFNIDDRPFDDTSHFEAKLEPVTNQVADKQFDKECPWCKKTISWCGNFDDFQQHRAACLKLVLKRRANGRDGDTLPENEHAEDESSDTEEQVCQEAEQRRKGSRQRSFVNEQATTKITPNDLNCVECKKNFDTEASATLHKKFVHYWGIFSCPDCTEQFNFADDIIQHIEQEAGHREDCKVKCPSCTDDFSLTNIANHYKKCIIREIQREKFGIYEEFRVHEKRYKDGITDSRKTPKECRKGRGNYPRISKSLEHIGERIICTLCGNSFKSQEILTRHNRIHLREQGAENDETPGKEPLYYNCEHCGKRFVSKTGYVLHRRRVHEGVHEKATCEVCGVTFITRDRLWRHKNMHHSNDDRYKCKYCDKQCSSTSWLARHIASTHEEPKFKCSFCDRAFTFKRKLEGHENEHKGLKPYKCKRCEASYASIDGLRGHTRKKHGKGIRVSHCVLEDF